MSRIYKAQIKHWSKRLGTTTIQWEAFGFDKQQLAKLMYAECYGYVPKAEWKPDLAEDYSGMADSRFNVWYCQITEVPTVC